MESLKQDHKEFIKNNKLILKPQQRFRREKHNVFTEEINKIALSSNDYKVIQLIDSIKTYAYGTGKDLICKKEEIKCKGVIKQYKIWLILMMLQNKTWNNIIQIGQNFLTIHTE